MLHTQLDRIVVIPVICCILKRNEVNWECDATTYMTIRLVTTHNSKQGTDGANTSRAAGKTR